MKDLWRRFSKRERGMVILTVIVLALFLVKFTVLTPLLDRREWVKSQLESQPQLLGKNLRYLNQKETLGASLETLRAQIKAYETKLLTGDTPSVSASDLQETVQALAGREGTQVITTRVLNPEPSGSFTKIGIQMEIGGQIQQLASLVKALEASPKLLIIDEITVRSLFRPVGLAQQQGAPQLPVQNLRVSLVVVGFARAQAGSAPKDAKSASSSQTGGGGI